MVRQGMTLVLRGMTSYGPMDASLRPVERGVRSCQVRTLFPGSQFHTGK